MYASEAHPAGLKASDFDAEAVAMSLGLIALMALNLPQPHSSIRILTDCQSLIITLSRGPARQSDSACTSISPLLHQQTPSIHIQWIPFHIGIPGNTLADLEAKRGSTLLKPQFLSTWQRRRLCSGGRDRRSFTPATLATHTPPHTEV